jgi:O-antigen ligase
LTSARHIATSLTWTVLLFLIPLAPVLGSAASIVASVLAIALIPFAIAGNGWRIARREPAMLVFIAVFLALAICFVVTARTPRDPLFAFNFLALPLAVALYVVATRAAESPRVVQTIATLCLAGTLTALAIALNDIFLRQLGYVYGFNLGPHVVARVALLLGFLALAGLFVTRSPWRFLFYLAPLAALVVVFLSGTRGALPAIPVMTLVLLAFLAFDRRDRLHFGVLVLLGIAALAVLALSSDRLASTLRVIGEVLGSGVTADSSAAERLGMLSAAWQLFLASPLVGHGWANFAAVAHPILEGRVWGGPTDPFFQFHNDLANFAVAAGSIGVLCWIVLLAAPIVGALTTPGDSRFRVRLYCCLQLSASYLVFGLTDMTLGYDLPTTLYAFLTAIVLGAFREDRAG